MNPVQQRSERLFQAIGGVGGDLIDLAEQRVFRPGVGRRLWPLAACLALIVSVGMLIRPLFLTEQDPQPQLHVPVKPEAAPEEPRQPAEHEWSDQPVAAKERLTVNGTIYYVEAVYETTSAKPGDRIGEVNGNAVFIGGETLKQDHWGREMPLEILVEQEDGYLYGLTYYAWDGAAYTMDDAKTMEDLAVLALGGTFTDPADLSEEELIEFFLQTLALEQRAGRRTEDLNRYLWYDEQQARYVIPVEDLAVQLDRYLDGAPWPKLAEHRALVLKDLTPPLRPAETFAAAVFEEDKLHLTTDRFDYIIRFEEGRCVYECVTPR